jgi:MscS family membrane protein
MDRLHEWIWLENSAFDLLAFFGVLVIGMLVRRLFSNTFSKLIYRFISVASVSIQDCIQLLRKPVELLLLWIILYLAVQNLHIPVSWHIASIENFGLLFIIQKAFETCIIISITWVIIRIMKVGILVAQEKWQGVGEKAKQQFIPFLNYLALVFIITGASFVILGRIFEVDVVALITGLGLGGLALALAARETLENLFASFTIFLDLPFVVGDTIQVGTISGDIEKIGFRSTRMRGVDGNLIVIPNRLLTSQSLENLTDREFRRAKFNLTCDLSTKTNQIESAIAAIEQTILEDPLCKKKAPKVVFEGFGLYSLDISVTFFVQTKDFGKYQQVKQEINIRILQILESKQINLASSVK